jgi:hypothetical protein
MPVAVHGAALVSSLVSAFALFAVVVSMLVVVPARGNAEDLEAGAVASPPHMASTSATTSATMPARTRWSEKRLFEVSYVATPSPVPLLTTHAWTVTIADGEGQPVRDATVTVLGVMPEHDHGFPTTPQVKPLGDGRYLVEGIKFHMPGDWVVLFRIQAGASGDSVRFELHL